MKIGLFSDSHYSSASLTCGCRYNSRSLDKLKEAYTIFAREGCDMVLCLGDLTDTEDSYEKECDNARACAAVMDASGIPTLCVMGNHDAFVYTEDAFYDLIGQHLRPHTVTAGNTTVLFIDACHSSEGRHYCPGEKFDWTDTFFPDTEELEKTLASCAGDIVVCMHQNLDPAIPENHRLSNDAALRALFEAYGVKHVISGHYHPGADHTEHGVHYLTLPALCERETKDAIRIFEIV